MTDETIVVPSGDMTGATDTANIRAALTTALPPYTVRLVRGQYYVSGVLTCSTVGQIIKGDGREVTVINVVSGFTPMTASGVFVLSFPGPPVPAPPEGPIFRDFGIVFDQPVDVSDRSDLIDFPPAFFLGGVVGGVSKAVNRVTFQWIRVQAAKVGIDATGNTGGLYLDLFECSAFDWVMLLDGAKDVVRLNAIHAYPFGLSPDQLEIYDDGSSNGLSVGRCDGLFLSNCFFVNGGQQLYTYVDSDSGFGPQVLASNTRFDTGAYVILTGGYAMFSSCHFGPYSPSTPSNPLVTITNDTSVSIAATNTTRVTFTGCHFQTDVELSSTVAIVIDANNSGAAEAIRVSFSGCEFWCPTNSTYIDTTGSAGYAEVSVTGCTFYSSFVGSYSRPVINIGEYSRVKVIGNGVIGSGDANGVFINVAHDDYHNIVGNDLGDNWSITLPSPPSLTQCGLNSGTGEPPYWTPYTPSASPSSGSGFSANVSGLYALDGKKCTALVEIQITANGTGSGRITCTLPFSTKALTYGGYAGSGTEVASTLKALSVHTGNASTTTATILFYDGTYPGATGYTLAVTMTYEID